MTRRKAALVCCSNALKWDKEAQIDLLSDLLLEYGIDTVRSECMFSDTPWGHGDGKLRSDQLMALYRDPSVTEIYDVSGGDLANEILRYLDYDVIRQNPKPFYGYSDLTVVLNAIYAKTGREGVLYQVRNLITDPTGEQRSRFNNPSLYDFSVDFLRGEHMEGIVVGGNIRCLLKLAGTAYFPDLTGKILLLEAYGGEVPQMKTYLSQLELLGAFDAIEGILLGTFTKMELSGCQPSMEELVLRMTRDDLPVAKTSKVGHGSDSAAVRIGGWYQFSEGGSLERTSK